MVVLAVLVATATLMLLARPLHDQLLSWVDAAEPLIRRHPTLGKATFVALAAVSALLAFFSSALLVPVAVYAAAEVPYAIGAVYLGASFLQRNPIPLIALGAAGALLSIVAAAARPLRAHRAIVRVSSRSLHLTVNAAEVPWLATWHIPPERT